MIKKTKVATLQQKYGELINVADEVLHSTKNGTESDFWEAIPELAETVDKLTGQTLEERWK